MFRPDLDNVKVSEFSSKANRRSKVLLLFFGNNQLATHVTLYEPFSRLFPRNQAFCQDFIVIPDGNPAGLIKLSLVQSS